MADINTSDAKGVPQPEANENLKQNAVPNTKNEAVISVKFNKEMIKLDRERAAELAQKGMKYEQISADYKRLRDLASAKGVGVSAYLGMLETEDTALRKTKLLESCGGNEELVEHIMKLENSKAYDYGFAELQEFFPEFKDIEQLPESVVSAARLKRSCLMDEYLRYLLLQNRIAKNAELQRKNSIKASIGSQLAFTDEQDGVNLAFLQGLWRS